MKNLNNSTSFTYDKLDPYFVTGYCDGEASFMVHIDLLKSGKWRITPSFSITLHSKDLPLLKSIQSFFGGIGQIYINDKNIIFRVIKLNDIAKVIIPHFNSYPLLTKKWADYILFTKVVSIVQTGVHLTEKGLHEILRIKASINRGLSTKLASTYPGVKPIERPEVDTVLNISNPSWLLGFVCADGSFSASNYNNKKKCFRVRFSVTQHARDLDLLKAIKRFFNNIGNIYKNGSGYNYEVGSYKDCSKYILPFFMKHRFPPVAFKSYNFFIWKEILEIMSTGEHKNENGKQKIVCLLLNINKYG